MSTPMTLALDKQALPAECCLRRKMDPRNTFPGAAVSKVNHDFRDSWRYAEDFALHRLFYVTFLEFKGVMHSNGCAYGCFPFAYAEENFSMAFH